MSPPPPSSTPPSSPAPPAQTVVYLRDRFVDPRAATVAVTDRGYLLGEGVFATMRGYDGVCFRSASHLTALARGARLFGMELPLSTEALADLADEAASRSQAREAYVRVTVARGTSDEAVLSILARAFDVPPEAAYVDGVDAVTVTLRRAPPSCFDPAVKSTSYGAQVLVRREVASRGAFEGVQLAVDGSVACGTMANLFVVRDRELLTPPVSTGCRAGVTRATVLSLAADLGLRASEATIAPEALADADEIFYASTRVECLPVATLDGAPTKGARRGVRDRYPVTRSVREALRRAIADDVASRKAARR